MSHYTRLTFWATVRDLAAIEAMQWMTGKIERPDKLPDHLLFAQPRAEMMLGSNIGAHQVGATMFRPSEWKPSVWLLNVDLSYKNYRDEIILFLDWISPYDANAALLGVPEFRGFIHYEEGIYPTLIHRVHASYQLTDFLT